MFGLIVGLISAGISLFGASKARSAARANASRIKAEGRERERRQAAEDKRTEARGRARAAASGVSLTGSPEGFLESLMSENRRELDFLRSNTDQRADAARSQGDAAFMSGLGSAFGSIAGAAKGSSLGGTGTTGGAPADMDPTGSPSQGWWE